MKDPFARWGAAMVRLRWVVLASWLVLLPLAGAFGASKVAGKLTGGGFSVAGSDAVLAAETLEREFNSSPDRNVVIVFRSSDNTVDDPPFRDAVTAAAARVKAVTGVRGVITFFDTPSPSLVSPDRRTTLAIATIDGTEDEVEERIGEVQERLEGTPIEHYITGSPAIGRDLSITSEEDLKRSELFTIPIVVLLLLIVFRTVISAAIPLVLGACSVVTAMALLYPIAANTDVSIFALNVTSMLGLGLGIDFSLIVVNRFREELQAGRDPQSAVAVTMATAGRSITYSGLTVFLGMLILTLMLNLTLVRSMSLAVLLVALTALFAGLTLLPALLGILGRRIEWLPVLPRRKVAQGNEDGLWYRLSHAIMRRPWVWLVVSVLLIGALAFPAKDIDVLGATAGVLPDDVGSAKGSKVMEEAFGASRLNPIEIVVQTGEQNGAWKPEALEAIAQLTDVLRADQRVQGVSSIATLAPNLPREQVRTLTPETFTSDPGRAAAAAQFINLRGNNDTAVITVIAKRGQYDDETEALVQDLRDTIIPGVRQLRAYDVKVGGGTANFLDLSEALYGRFPWLVAVVMLLTFVMLMMFFQSVFLPVKAILMNLASIAATYGVLVLIFQHGWGADLLGFEALGKLNLTTPVILFVILLGLSTDYEVFMLARVKEFFHETGNNEEAVAAGLENTARVITAAGLILIGTFGSFAMARNIIIKEIGLGLAIGVMLDSTVVRAIMVPASMRLMGKWNWWMPAWLKRIVPELREGPAPELAPVAPPYGPSAAAPRRRPLDAAAQPHPVAAQPAFVGAPGVPATPSVGHQQPVVAAQGPPPATAMVGRLRPTGASLGTDEIVLPKRRPLRIGRSSEAELWLFDPRISRHHARVDYDRAHGRFVVTDLHSVNGVYINDRRITQPTPLRHGDHLEIGTTGQITFVYEERADTQPGRGAWQTGD